MWIRNQTGKKMQHECLEYQGRRMNRLPTHKRPKVQQLPKKLQQAKAPFRAKSIQSKFRSMSKQRTLSTNSTTDDG
ncbi:hypothetical protein MtrunA17_Chr3g0140981 [Medicago truncatula]|uniref:Uncharacterized protein n=1 Tax=Medicago truncatula TaxID=3880 RepID=I3SNR2_MEDTR|nr:unknown [Medicago truncatula]RHN70947.1 hypothetical protein MtrunA17_Chr3g0140981 [Medicago truncatula]